MVGASAIGLSGPFGLPEKRKKHAMCGPGSLDAVLVNAGIATDRKGGGIDEADPCTAAELCVQIGHQRHQDAGHQLDNRKSQNTPLDVSMLR